MLSVASTRRSGLAVQKRGSTRGQAGARQKCGGRQSGARIKGDSGRHHGRRASHIHSHTR